MKKLIFGIITVVCFITGNSQSKVQGIVNYGQLESMGMGSPIGLDFNSVLLFNKKESIYISHKDSLEKGHINKMVSIKINEHSSMISTKVTNELGFQYYQNKDSVYNRDLGFRYIKDKLPIIDWQLKSDVKKIGKLNCNKAIANFRGREYTAWYTFDIPLPYGPWKLHGLPGLILEAYDTNKEVYFYFKSIEFPTKKKLTINKPHSKNWINSKTFKNELTNAYNNSIINGRMVAEKFNTQSQQQNNKMGKSYIENFQK